MWAAANSYTAGMTERKIKIFSFSSGIRSIAVRGKVQWSHHRHRGATIGPKWLSTNDSSSGRLLIVIFFFFFFIRSPTDDDEIVLRIIIIIFSTALHRVLYLNEQKGIPTIYYYYTRGGAISLCDGVYCYYRHRCVYIYILRTKQRCDSWGCHAVADDSAYILSSICKRLCNKLIIVFVFNRPRRAYVAGRF